MVNVEKLQSAIRSFETESRPHSYSNSSSATIEDINNLRSSVVRVLQKFVDELDHQ